jgi:AcrR family transcriptional regulator
LSTGKAEQGERGTDEIGDGARTPPRASEKVLRSARKLFYERGIRAIGVDEIVADAGVTKPSLYRSYASKDMLAASYLRLYEQEVWGRFDAAMARHPGDPRGGLLDYLDELSQRVTQAGYRGCGLSNAAVEYPAAGHPARLVTEQHKAKLRERLRQIAGDMGAPDPDLLADGLFLLLEGALISSQIFREGSPSVNVGNAARLLIKAATGS